MACSVTLAQLIDILGAEPVRLSPTAFASPTTGITTDSRNLQPGEVFLALRGENFDGHEFILNAFAQGAIAAIVNADSQLDTATGPLLKVPNTLAAYQAIAHWWRQQFTIPIIAVTGSVGKTTTKELIAAVLSQAARYPDGILKSQANFNNEIGLPKTLLELGANHKFAVVEMGMRGRGEIALLTQIAEPDVAVITNVGTAHIGRLGSEEAIAQAKCELLADMPATGTAILNHDNPLLLQTAATVWGGRCVTYGLEGGDIHGQFISPDSMIVDGWKFSLPLPGRHNALNFLAALAVAKVVGIDWAELTDVSVHLPGGRARRYELPGDVVILDETYNAGLESMLAALDLLAQTPAQRRIAVLGTMKELGERSPEFHQRVGAAVRTLNLDHLLILADAAEAHALAEGAAPLITEQFNNHVAVVERLKTLVQPGDCLLFKASRAVGLEQVVEQFRAAYTPK